MDELRKNAENLFGIKLTPAQESAFITYEKELIAWNARSNLTAIDDPGQIRVKHFLDSLSCTLAMRDTPSEKVVDIGSGAGFPGYPLKIVHPSIQMSLVESIGKKADFCRHVRQVLNLQEVAVIQERAETASHQPDLREEFDWALARAVAGLPVLVEYLLPFVRIGGFALAMKGDTGPAEAQSASEAIQILGGQVERLIRVKLPGVVHDRYLVVIKKISATPDNFPRRVGIPAKRPLGTMP
jgi:16S rRNA (guanine527-N7)-methyltransferase